MAYRIIHDWWTECSACGGNAILEGEDSHIHGGPDPGGSMGPRGERSYLDQTNGCRASFNEPEVRNYL
jgi:hypothetical protein